jgi:hypothetical protein
MPRSSASTSESSARPKPSGTGSTAGPADPGRGATTPVPEGATLESLWTEVQRLRDLLGPSEDDYIQLRLDVLGARDAAMGAEMQLGQARALIISLGAEVDRARRDHLWLRRALVRRLIEFKGLVRSVPKRAVMRLIAR